MNDRQDQSGRTHLCYDLTTNKLYSKLNTIIDYAYLRIAAKVHYSIHKVVRKDRFEAP